MIDIFRQWWRKVHARTETPNLRMVRRIVVAVIGFTVLLFGVLMIVLPGPAFLVIPAGLAILGLEFEWARQWLQRVREMARQVSERAGRKSAAKKESEVEVLSGLQRRPTSEQGA